MSRIHFLDVTNRDGVQTARTGLSKFGKTMVNFYLGKLGVAQSEIGFPFLFHEVPYVRAQLALQQAGALGDLRLSGWCRAVVADVEAAAPLGLAHYNLSISTSDQMLRGKFRGRLDRDAVIRETVAAVRAAKAAGAQTVGVNAEDGSRTDDAFLAEFALAAKEAGADRLRYCDTIGGDTPGRIRERFAKLATAAGMPVETHCHNDLGLAVANSLSGALGDLDAGQDAWINTCVNGIGERAGNADLVSCILALRHGFGVPDTARVGDPLDLTWAQRFALWAAYALGQPLPNNQPGVGANAFAHESGIHADGALKDHRNYELYDEELLGPYPADRHARTGRLVLTGEYGGKAGFRHVMADLDVEVEDEELAFRLVQLCNAATGRPLTDDELRLIAGYPHQLAPLFPNPCDDCAPSYPWRTIRAVVAAALAPRMPRGFVLVAVPALALPAGVAAATLIAASHRVDHPGLRAFETLLGGWAFVAGGLVAWARQPANRIGALMVLTGFLLLAGALSTTDGALPATLGALAGPVANAVGAHLLLAFPDGRLHSRVERVLVAALYLTVTVGQWVMLSVMDYRTASGCPCPRNLLYAWHNPPLHDALMNGQRAVAVVIVAGLVLALAQRWRAATPPLRRSLAPVLTAGAVAALLAGVLLAVAALAPDGLSSSPAGAVISLAPGLALAFVPLGFLVGLLRLRLARAAVGDLVIELGRTMAPGQLRGAMARALGDPSLELAYRLPDAEAYVDLDGQPVRLPPDGGTRAVTFVERDGRRVAAVLHDASLGEDRALVEAACAAAGLALDNERLQAELRARLADLRSSRARIVQAGDTERRRLERNLHDGAQQRILAVSFALGLAQSRLPGDPDGARDIVTAARDELSQALEELRELARGIHPAILTSRGLDGALQALAMSAPVPVELAVPADRLPAPVEAAAYYLVTEAVANATKHARAQAVSVAVSRRDGTVLVTVTDDGVGGADPAGGSGLRGLADRVEALDGHLSVSSPAGRGTTIQASIPCA